MPPADCIHLVQRRNITHFLIRTVCLSGYIRQKDDFIDCLYSNILACLLYVTYVRLGHVHVYVHMCEEMFVSRISYNITIFHCFCSLFTEKYQVFIKIQDSIFIFLVGCPINQQSLTINKIW